jgi:hypothetical protein
MRAVVVSRNASSGLALADVDAPFGGMTVEETADVLNVSPQTVMRDWKLARAWLARELRR